MSKTPDTITDKLFEQSDKALRAEIDAAAAQLAGIITNGNQSLYSYELRDPKTEARTNGFGMLERMKQIAFDGLRNERRERAVREFMARFEQFSNEIEWLKNQQND